MQTPCIVVFFGFKSIFSDLKPALLINAQLHLCCSYLIWQCLCWESWSGLSGLCSMAVHGGLAQHRLRGCMWLWLCKDWNQLLWRAAFGRKCLLVFHETFLRHILWHIPLCEGTGRWSKGRALGQFGINAEVLLPLWLICPGSSAQQSRGTGRRRWPGELHRLATLRCPLGNTLKQIPPASSPDLSVGTGGGRRSITVLCRTHFWDLFNDCSVESSKKRKLQEIKTVRLYSSWTWV